MDYPGFDFYDEKYHRKIEKLMHMKNNITGGSNISNLILIELRKIVSQQLQDYYDRTKETNESVSDEYFNQCDSLLSIIDLFSVYYIPVIVLVGLVGKSFFNYVSFILFLIKHISSKWKVFEV